MSEQDSYTLHKPVKHRFKEAFPAFVRSDNNTYHRSIGIAPATVNDSNQEIVWQRLNGSGGGRGNPKLQTGDNVRISKATRRFKKGYMANWSEELFTVVETHPSDVAE
ncbi:MAG: hypothetical protein M3H12_01510 [Chromatiales bacterium]